MNAPEAVALCRYAKACCPQQAFDEYTPDAWHSLLDDLRFVDAKDALTELAKRQPFVAPAEIRDEVKRTRSDRIARAGPLDPPPWLEAIEDRGEFDREYMRWYRETLTAIADGEPAPQPIIEPSKAGRERVQALAAQVGTRLGGKRTEVQDEPSTEDA